MLRRVAHAHSAPLCISTCRAAATTFPAFLIANYSRPDLAHLKDQRRRTVLVKEFMAVTGKTNAPSSSSSSSSTSASKTLPKTRRGKAKPKQPASDTKQKTTKGALQGMSFPQYVEGNMGRPELASMKPKDRMHLLAAEYYANAPQLQKTPKSKTVTTKATATSPSKPVASKKATPVPTNQEVHETKGAQKQAKKKTKEPAPKAKKIRNPFFAFLKVHQQRADIIALPAKVRVRVLTAEYAEAKRSGRLAAIIAPTLDAAVASPPIVTAKKKTLKKAKSMAKKKAPKTKTAATKVKAKKAVAAVKTSSAKAKPKKGIVGDDPFSRFVAAHRDDPDVVGRSPTERVRRLTAKFQAAHRAGPSDGKAEHAVVEAAVATKRKAAPKLKTLKPTSTAPVRNTEVASSAEPVKRAKPDLGDFMQGCSTKISTRSKSKNTRK